MHVTIVYPGKRPVPPPLYGGGQRVMYWLGKALVQLGHQVTLIAHSASHIPGVELRPVAEADPAEAAWHRLIPATTDILHLRKTPRTPPPRPFVVTVGGNGRPGQTFHPHTIFLSRHHAANHQSVHFVHNGLDSAEYECAAVRGDYAVFLAKASWDVKNVRGAVQVCRRAGVKLHVIGSRNWPLNLHRWLPEFRGVHYHGMLGGQPKAGLLARARCLIFPVRWHEPFGNAITEALASGCYVAATPYGSLPEIVTPDVGVLSTSAAELAEAVSNPGRFRPEICRNHVLHGGFTHLDMARKYLSYYEKVLATGRLGAANEPVPQTQPGFDANRLLPWAD